MQNEEFIDTAIENQFIFSRHEILVDSTLKSLQTPEGIKAYAKRALRRAIHDDAEISAVKLKRPHVVAKSVAKLARRPPMARLYVTTKF